MSWAFFYGRMPAREVRVLRFFMPTGWWNPGAADTVVRPQRTAERPAGTVWLVGAGPGDPELISVRGLRLLRRADVIVHDRLVAPELLAECRRRAVLIDVGKRPGRHAVSQAGIERLLVTHARAGREVVRLKGGDPFIFGRGGEEMASLRAAGIAVEVVPGITAAAGCAAAAGFPLTQRQVADSVCLVTASHEHDEDDAHWASLASDRQRTLVFYMGLSRLSHIRQQLCLHGLPPETPAALIENGSTRCQRRVFCTLAEIDREAERHGLTTPCLLVVGQVTALAAGPSSVVTHPSERSRMTP